MHLHKRLVNHVKMQVTVTEHISCCRGCIKNLDLTLRKFAHRSGITFDQFCSLAKLLRLSTQIETNYKVNLFKYTFGRNYFNPENLCLISTCTKRRAINSGNHFASKRQNATSFSPFMNGKKIN